MGTTTFSGPVRSGTVVSGVGTAVITQAYTIPFAAILTSPAALNAFAIPANSRIVNFSVMVETALVTATNCGITVGKVGGTADFFVTTFNTGATVAKVTQATVDTAMQVAAMANVGISDVVLTITPTAAGGNATVGSITVMVNYIQQ